MFCWYLTLYRKLVPFSIPKGIIVYTKYYTLSLNGWLYITKKKHVTEVDNKGNSRKKRKRKVSFNMNKIMEIAGAKSYKCSFDRFSVTDGIEIVDDKEKNCIRIKIDMSEKDSKVLFKVSDIYNSMIYLQAHQQGKKLSQCKVCGKDFIKTSSNQKTCGVRCQDILHKFQVAETNKRNRQAAIEEKQAI